MYFIFGLGGYEAINVRNIGGVYWDNVKGNRYLIATTMNGDESYAFNVVDGESFIYALHQMTNAFFAKGVSGA